jgi:hypothetical protein
MSHVIAEMTARLPIAFGSNGEQSLPTPIPTIFTFEKKAVLLFFLDVRAGMCELEHVL